MFVLQSKSKENEMAKIIKLQQIKFLSKLDKKLTKFRNLDLESILGNNTKTLIIKIHHFKNIVEAVACNIGIKVGRYFTNFGFIAIGMCRAIQHSLSVHLVQGSKKRGDKVMATSWNLEVRLAIKQSSVTKVYHFLKWFQHIGRLKPCVAINDPYIGCVSLPNSQNLVHCLDKLVKFRHTLLHTLHALIYALNTMVYTLKVIVDLLQSLGDIL